MSDETTVAIQQVDARRRGFLTKLLTGGAALAALPAMSTMALGDEQAAGGKGKGGGGKGKGGEAGGQGKGRGGGRQMDPKKMAAEMLAKYDKDGDKALNEAELVAALTAMVKQRGGQQRGGQQGGGKGKGGGGTGGSGKGKGGGGRGKGIQ